jgi:hypothetical protein
MSVACSCFPFTAVNLNVGASVMRSPRGFPAIGFSLLVCLPSGVRLRTLGIGAVEILQHLQDGTCLGRILDELVHTVGELKAGLPQLGVAQIDRLAGAWTDQHDTIQHFKLSL